MLSDYSLKGRLLRALLGRRGAAVVHMADAAGRRGPGPRPGAPRVAPRRGQRGVALVRETHGLALLLVQDASALQILACVRACRGVGGAMAEAGVFAGASARLICEAKGDASLHLFDVFETLQAPPGLTGDTKRAVELRRHFKT